MLSKTDIFFLMTFFKPRRVEDLPVMSSAEWSQILGEDPLTVTQRFEKAGWVIPASIADHLDYKFNIEELRSLLKQQSLPTSGTKTELILRLISADYESASNAVSDIRLLQCSDKGRKLIEENLQDIAIDPGFLRDLRIPAQELHNVIKWIIVTVAGGVLGNAAYDALKRFWENIATSPAPRTSPLPIPISPDAETQNRIEYLGRTADGVKIRIHIGKAAPLDKPTVVLILKSYGAPVYASVHITLDDVADRKDRYLLEAKMLQNVISACFESGVCKGFSVPRSVLFEEEGSQPKISYYIICLLYTSPSPRDS